MNSEKISRKCSIWRWTMTLCHSEWLWMKKMASGT